MKDISSYHEAVHCLVFKLVWGLYLTVHIGSLRGQSSQGGCSGAVVRVLRDGRLPGSASTAQLLLPLSSFTCPVSLVAWLIFHSSCTNTHLPGAVFPWSKNTLSGPVFLDCSVSGVIEESRWGTILWVRCHVSTVPPGTVCAQSIILIHSRVLF